MDNTPKGIEGQPWRADSPPSPRLSPPDFAAVKHTKGKLKRPPDMGTSSGEDIESGKRVKFNNETDMRAITPFVSKNVEVEHKSNISIIEEHKPILKEKYRKITELYRKLRNILSSDELTTRAGFNTEHVRTLQNTYKSFHDLKKKETISDEDCKKFLEITEEAMSMLEKLEGIEEEVKKSKKEPHSDTEKQT